MTRRYTAPKRSRSFVTVITFAVALGIVPIPAEETRVVAFAQDTLANDWRRAQARDLEHAFSDQPDIEFLLADAAGSTAMQIRHVEDFTDRGVDVLIVSPRDADAMRPAISRAYRQGIPVVLITRGIRGEEYTSFVGPDDEEIARDAARFIADRLGESGRVLMLQGVPTASTAVDRTRGFEREITRYPGIEIVGVLPGNYLRGDAMIAMDRFLETHPTDLSRNDPGFDALYAQSDSMAIGARRALTTAGYDVSELVIVGIDYIAEAREAIRSGEQTATYIYPTSAVEAAEVVREILDGLPAPRSVHVPSTRVTEENAELLEPIF